MGNSDDWTKADVSAVVKGSSRVPDWCKTTKPVSLPPQFTAAAPPPVAGVANMCPLCPGGTPPHPTEPDLHSHLAREHFADFLKEAGVPLEGAALLKCPKCAFCSEKYPGLLKHYLVHHRQLEVLQNRSLGVHKNDDDDVDDATDPTAGPEVVDGAGGQGNRCRMCDDVRFISGTQGDFFKHLVETHFR